MSLSDLSLTWLDHSTLLLPSHISFVLLPHYTLPLLFCLATYHVSLSLVSIHWLLTISTTITFSVLNVSLRSKLFWNRLKNPFRMIYISSPNAPKRVWNSLFTASKCGNSHVPPPVLRVSLRKYHHWKAVENPIPVIYNFTPNDLTWPPHLLSPRPVPPQHHLVYPELIFARLALKLGKSSVLISNVLSAKNLTQTPHIGGLA